MRTDYEVSLSGADNGYIARIGCKTLVFKETELDEMLADLKIYLTGGSSKLYAKYFPKELPDRGELVSGYVDAPQMAQPTAPGGPR